MAITADAGLELQPLIRSGWDDWDDGRPWMAGYPSAFKPEAAVPAGPQVRFLDLSHWQNDRGRIDYTQVKRAGYGGVVAKLTEGTGFVDPWGVWNVTEAAKHGLVAGGYHFLRRDGSLLQQFAAFRRQLEVAGPVAGRIVMLDAETAGNGSDPTLDQADQWSELCRAEWGILPWQYYPRWWLNKVRGCPTVHGSWIQSAYGPDPGPLICGYTRIAGWQFTSSAAVPGISGNVDANRWFGDLASLQATTIGGSEEDMPLNDDDLKKIRGVVQAELIETLRAGFGGVHPGASNDAVRASQGWLFGQTKAHTERLEAIEAWLANLSLAAGDPQATAKATIDEFHARTAPPPDA